MSKELPQTARDSGAVNSGFNPKAADREKTKIQLELNGILFNFGLPRRRSTAGYDDAYDLPAPGFLSPEGSEYPGISGPDGGRAALCIWDIWRIERG